jgi:protocatechuate 3,4-dioxygenase beta subunit
MKALVLAVAACGAPQKPAAEATAVIEGKVTDAATGQPVAGVEVYVMVPEESEGVAGQTTTRADGTYHIDIAPGPYTVILPRSGREHFDVTLKAHEVKHVDLVSHTRH